MIPEKKKQLSPNIVTDDGIVIDFNDLQKANALSPIDVTDDGIVIDDNDEQ